MSTQKEDLLKSITSFIGAENELAIKEAEHQIVVFNALLENEISNFNELSKKQESEESTFLDPRKEELNISILEAIDKFKINQEKKKAAKEKSEKENLVAKKKLLEKFEELVNNKEKLAELAGGIKEIRAEWNLIGEVSQRNHQEINYLLGVVP